MPLLSYRLMLRAAQLRPAALRLSLLLTVSAVAMPGAAAQVVVGTAKGPSVTVDWGVLDTLGPPPTLPQLLLQQRGAPTRPLAAQPRTTEKLAAHRPAGHAAAAHRATRHLASLHAHRPSKHRIARKATGPGRVAQAAAANAPAQPPKMAAASPAAIHLIRPGSLPAAHQEALAQDQEALAQEKPAAPPPSEALAAKTPPVPPPPAPPVDNSPPVATAPEPIEAAAPPSQTVTEAGDRNSPPSASLLRVGSPSAPAADASPPAAAPPAPATEPPPASSSPSSLLRVATPAAPAPAERMVASLNPQLGPAAGGAAAAGVTSAVRFAPGLANIPADARPILDAVVAKLKANDALRVQLIAYAAGGDDDAIEARRLSLARAVAVRAYLIEGGVRSLRMDVRALGNRSDGGGPSDRVDLVLVNQ